MRMTLEPWYGWGDERTFRFYVGATPDDPVEGMYSFVPARQVDGVRSGFARPAIELWGLVNPNVRMQARTSPAIPLSEIATCWREIAKGVLDSGLVLATRLEEPGGEA